jgi:ribosome maturation factor RimP
MIQEDLVQLLSPIIADLGYDFWGCEYLSQGKHSLLRIYIDKQTGIGVEDCERVSKQVSAILDVEDPIPGNYSLEISSPGIPRPLFYGWQYDLYKGSIVQLKLYKPVTNTRKLSGVILSVTAETVVLEIGHEHQEIQFSNIVKANLIV